MIASNTHVTLKRTKSHLCECHLTSCSTHYVWLHQVFLAQLAHPTIVASELRGDDQSQIALKLMTVFDHNFDTNLNSMINKKHICCAVSSFKDILFVLQFKTLAFFRNLRHSKYLFALQFVYN